ncbi:hypothetical protein ESB00_13315 [Oleiharenicola lentus]|jgi:hypothetical protein|uniref:Copper chaperone PCu(A)C n=1 Tax=Oleiharenicola lentus TaxID=2508720 RepID=A0A4Q1CCF3_9BACT|nr:hypothetical protein [Oleiharenicola lentus]RXK56804.1 hypothetical protein ESB00_13315 [Oleiharenicola lentus]
MNQPLRFISTLRGLCALALIAGLAFVAPALNAAEKAPALPLKASFEKVASTEGTPFVLHLKNESKDSLKVSGKVLLSVVHHAMDKARAVPEATVAAGASLTIKDLSAEDRVVLTAAGYESLEIRVPAKP